jgi:hypothetical protein
MIDYNTNSIQDLAFVLNGEKIWVHWGAIYPKTIDMLLVIETSLALVMELMKVECK